MVLNVATYTTHDTHRYDIGTYVYNSARSDKLRALTVSRGSGWALSGGRVYESYPAAR